MEENLQLPKQLLSSAQILSLISRMLIQLNPTLGNPCVQSTYITAKILQDLPACGIDKKTAILLSLTHLFGHYHFLGENPLNRPSLTQDDIRHFFTYGYYYLKEMTPLGENAKAILFFDRKYDKKLADKVVQVEYSSLVFTSDSIQRLIDDTKGNYVSENFEEYEFSKFNPKYLAAFKKIDSSRDVSNKIAQGNYLPELDKIYESLDFSEADRSQLIKLLVYVIDFKSTQTVQHVIHTAGYAVALGKAMGCSQSELNELYTAGILHDLGKLSIPNIILESPGKLSSFEYRVMQMHVEETENILRGLVDEKLLQMAIRHHEKLNGKGYPNRLSGDELTIPQRLLTGADLLSALVDKRSYKGKFNKEKIIQIFKDEAVSGAIDIHIPEFIEKKFDELQSQCNFYGALLTVPLGKVEIEYQEEISSELEDLS